jgi:TrmH family RNA methyltransferase
VDKRLRLQESLFVAEGTRWLKEVVRLSVTPTLLFYTEQWAQTAVHADLLQQVPLSPQIVSEPVMAAMSDTQTPPGILLALPMQPSPIPPRPDLLLILDGVTNPGNLGTILRTAGAAGVDAVLLGPDCVDAYNPKVVRGGMGAHLRLPLWHLSWPEIAAQVGGLQVWLADVAQGVAYTAVDWRQPSALIIGSEATGVGAEAVALVKGNPLANGRLTIPMQSDTESLNAAMATGVILFEAMRQRHS